jgi:hypothetical protein
MVGYDDLVIPIHAEACITEVGGQGASEGRAIESSVRDESAC